MNTVVENEQVRRPLAESSEVSLTVNLDGMHQLLGGQDHSEYADADAEYGCGGECGWGHPSDLDAPWEVAAQ